MVKHVYVNLGRGYDKWVHVVTFSFIAVLFALALPLTFYKQGEFSLVVGSLAAAFVLILLVSYRYVQDPVARTFEIGDEGILLHLHQWRKPNSVIVPWKDVMHIWKRKGGNKFTVKYQTDIVSFAGFSHIGFLSFNAQTCNDILPYLPDSCRREGEPKTESKE